MRRSNASNATRMNGAAPEVGTTHASSTPVETSATTETTASAPASECVIGNNARANESERGETSENVPEHGALLGFMLFD